MVRAIPTKKRFSKKCGKEGRNDLLFPCPHLRHAREDSEITCRHSSASVLCDNMTCAQGEREHAHSGRIQNHGSFQGEEQFNRKGCGVLHRASQLPEIAHVIEEHGPEGIFEVGARRTGVVMPSRVVT